MEKNNVRYLEENEYCKWDEFVDESPQGNIFNKSYWLKAVSSDLKILVYEENDKIVGGIALPSLYGKYYRNPKLTPQIGILLPSFDSNIKYSSRISKETEIASALISKFPKFKSFDYNFSYNYTTFLPFIWENYNINVRYTYVIEDLTDLDKVYADFQYSVRRSLKKAQKSNIKITDEYGINEFYLVNKMTYERQKMEIPYTLEFLTEVDNVLDKNNNRKIFFAVNSDNKIIAAVYLIYDQNCAYYLMGGADPEYRDSGAQILLLWETIKYASTVSHKYDFEGSMVKNIERVFREFGGKQKIIYNVNKSDMLTKAIYEVARKNKNIIRKVFKV